MATLLENPAYAHTFALFLQAETDAEREEFLLELGISGDDVEAVASRLGVVGTQEKERHLRWFRALLEVVGATEGTVEPDVDRLTAQLVAAGLPGWTGAGWNPLGIGLFVGCMIVSIVKSWRPLFLISAAFALFGLLLEPLGLMVAIAASVVLSAFADETHKPVGVVGLVVFLCALCWAVFIYELDIADSEIRESHREGDTRVQDPYCIRCQPQVTGACLDLLWQAGRTLEIEANAATDNPLVLTRADEIVSGGNFHAEPVAFAADQIALAIAEIGSISQRRIALMVDPALSHDLPPFLTPDPGLNSGLMIAEVTSAALMSENKHLATPCSTDSTPTSANQEDHVSMAAHGARRLKRMNANLAQIVGIEAMCGAAGVEFRAPLRTSARLAAVIARLRADVAPLEQDRYLAPDLAKAAALVRSDGLVGALPATLLDEVRP